MMEEVFVKIIIPAMIKRRDDMKSFSFEENIQLTPTPPPEWSLGNQSVSEQTLDDSSVPETNTFATSTQTTTALPSINLRRWHPRAEGVNYSSSSSAYTGQITPTLQEAEIR